MNNTYFIFLIRRDHVLQLAAHLAAGVLALVVLTGAFRSDASESVASNAQHSSAALVSR